MITKLRAGLFAAAALRCVSLAAVLLLTCGQAYAFDDDYTAPINGTSLHFRVRGASKSNPYLLILHGGPGFSAHMFYSWGESLEHNLNVVYLDQRGCGQSKHMVFTTPLLPSEDEVKDYTISNLVTDIEGVREYLKVDKWYVLGYSWGAMLGVEYITAHPDRSAGFMIMDGIISQPRAQDSVIDSLQARFEKQRAESTDPAKKSDAVAKLATIMLLRQMPAGTARMNVSFSIAGQLFDKMYFAHPDKATGLQSAIKRACKQYGVPISDVAAVEPVAALQITERYGSKDDTSLLAGMSTPTLIINGRQDEISTPVVAKLIQAAIQKSRIVLIDSCGNFPFIEQPEHTTSAILGFINGLHH